MPYVATQIRRELDDEIAELEQAIIDSSADDTVEGHMNYAITSLLNAIPLAGNSTDELGDAKWRYKYINRAIGVLECVKQEFYRRLAAPYEDEAIEKNGDLPIYDQNNNIS